MGGEWGWVGLGGVGWGGVKKKSLSIMGFEWPMAYMYM